MQTLDINKAFIFDSADNNLIESFLKNQDLVARQAFYLNKTGLSIDVKFIEQYFTKTKDLETFTKLDDINIFEADGDSTADHVGSISFMDEFGEEHSLHVDCFSKLYISRKRLVYIGRGPDETTFSVWEIRKKTH